MIISECLLVYMKSCDSVKIMEEYSSMFPACAFINYEMITPDDKFGEMMVENIEQRGCSLLGLRECPSLDA